MLNLYVILTWPWDTSISGEILFLSISVRLLPEEMSILINKLRKAVKQIASPIPEHHPIH